MSSTNGFTLCPKGKAMEFKEAVCKGGSGVINWVKENPKTAIGTALAAFLLFEGFRHGVVDGHLMESLRGMTETASGLLLGFVTKVGHDISKER